MENYIVHPYCARFSREQRVHMSACAQRKKGLILHARLDSEINAGFLFNERGDPPPWI